MNAKGAPWNRRAMEPASSPLAVSVHAGRGSGSSMSVCTSARTEGAADDGGGGCGGIRAGSVPAWGAAQPATTDADANANANERRTRRRIVTSVPRARVYSLSPEMRHLARFTLVSLLV